MILYLFQLHFVNNAHCSPVISDRYSGVNVNRALQRPIIARFIAIIDFSNLDNFGDDKFNENLDFVYNIPENGVHLVPVGFLTDDHKRSGVLE